VNDRDHGLEPEPLARSTGDLEREAADALRPIFERTLAELGVGPAKARLLMRQIAEAYMTGRAEGISMPPHKVNRALSAEGIAIALALQHGPITAPSSRIGTRASGLSEGLHWLDLAHPPVLGPETAEQRASIESEREALEAMGRGFAHSVTVEVVLDWDDHGRLGELLVALDARPEFLGPPVGAEVGERVIGVTVMVKARTEKAAQEIATRALLEEMEKLGLVAD
jgi:hypothetical protein